MNWRCGEVIVHGKGARKEANEVIRTVKTPSENAHSRSGVAARSMAVSFPVHCRRFGSRGVTDRIWAAVLPDALPILSNSGTTAESRAAAVPPHDRAYKCERHLGW